MNLDALTDFVNAFDTDGLAGLADLPYNTTVGAFASLRAVLDAPRKWWCKPAGQLWPTQSCDGQKRNPHLYCGWVRVIEEEQTG